MSSDPDKCVPTVVTDFIFDLYESVTSSQIIDEQTKLYTVIQKELTTKYFDNTPWPSAQSIARECNGDPLFLAVYRELTHRHWHAVSRPTLRDRIDGWDVYRELFEEILDNPNFYLLPVWVFEILHEFLYQFQGFCQIRTSVYTSARKNGLLSMDGTINIDTNATSTTTTGSSGGGTSTGNTNSNNNKNDKHANFAENLTVLQNNTEAWDVETVFSYLHRLIEMGMPSRDPAAIAAAASDSDVQPVNIYFSLFGSVVLSRLECLMGDYTASLHALYPVHLYQDYPINKVDDDDESIKTVSDVLQSVFGARLSLSYHAGISYMMLGRYKDAVSVLADCAGAIQRLFKTGSLRTKYHAGGDQFSKQYDRIVSLLAILLQICPDVINNNSLLAIEDAVVRTVRDKHAVKIEIATSYEEWFLSPKFISNDPHNSVFYRQQVDLFLQEMNYICIGKKLRSYLKLYTSIPLEKLAKFHDMNTADEFLPILLSYKLRMRQKERQTTSSSITTNGKNETSSTAVVSTSTSNGSYLDGIFKTALDIHYYIDNGTVLIDEAEVRRRFENYFVTQITQSLEIRQDVLSVDTNI